MEITEKLQKTWFSVESQARKLFPGVEYFFSIRVLHTVALNLSLLNSKNVSKKGINKKT